jgi:LDH2 family malate/lactate/ureidoglycolate dehydrogenase
MNVSAELLSRQCAAILRAWGLPEDHVEAVTHVLVTANLRGVDSHGVSMLTLYDEFRRNGKLTLRPGVRVVRESPVTALLDGDGGLGHLPGMKAMRLAIEKCAATGVGVVGVRNANHFGAAGVYALLAPERGFIGVAMTATWRPGIVPTFGAEAMLGTNPIAFAAPAKRNPPFCLDMATSTVALNKIKLAALHGRGILPGWALDDRGRPVTDAREAMKHVLLTPLGGTAELGSHKGYGLATMVEILCSTLNGASAGAIRNRRDPDATRHNVGQFYLALDPKCFREPGEFERDMDDLIDALHATKPADPRQPVLVAGDPEQACFAQRSRDGIPLSNELSAMLRTLADACAAEWVLD